MNPFFFYNGKGQSVYLPPDSTPPTAYASPTFLAALREAGHIAPARPSGRTNVLLALETMLLAKFRKLGPTGLGNGRFRVMYQDAELRLTKTEIYEPGDAEDAPSAIQFQFAGSDRRHVFTADQNADEQRDVMAGLVGELESIPTRQQIVAARLAQKQGGTDGNR